MNRVTKRLLVGASVVGAVALIASPVSAHVTIDTMAPVAQGGFSKLGISVPNERDDAGTTQVEVQMPADHPLVFVSVQPKPGWQVATTMRTLEEPVEAFGATYDEAVDTVTWTADEGTRIGPGEFDVFWLSVGPIPADVDSLVFPAVQTYDSGEIVRWIEPTPASGEEPEHPAPAVAVVAGSGDDHHASGTESSGADTSDTDAAGDTGSDDDSSSTLAVIALIVGGLGLIAGIAALAASRKRSV